MNATKTDMGIGFINKSFSHERACCRDWRRSPSNPRLADQERTSSLTRSSPPSLTKSQCRLQDTDCLYPKRLRALRNSGYLTDVSIILTNKSAALARTGRVPGARSEIRNALSSVTNGFCWGYSLCTNSAGNSVWMELDCRSNDIPAYRKAFERF